jgi:hypothetical protein
MKKESETFLLKLLNGNKNAVEKINSWFLCRRDKSVDYITEKQNGVFLYYCRELSLFNFDDVVKETFCVFYNNNKKNKEIFFDVKNNKGGLNNGK